MISNLKDATGPEGTAGEFPGTPKRPGTGLTLRQKQVLQLLVEGLSSRQIADRLGLSFYTVTTHLKTVYGKLAVHNRAQAVSKVLTEGLLIDLAAGGIPAATAGRSLVR